MKTPRLYKWLNEDGSCIWGVGAWPLPKEAGKLGAWMPALDGELAACYYGYHAFEAGDLIQLLPIGRAMLVEVRLVRPVKEQGKWVAAKGRVMRVVFPHDAVAEYQRVSQPARGEYLRTNKSLNVQYGRNDGITWDEFTLGQREAEDQYRIRLAELLDTAGREPGASA